MSNVGNRAAESVTVFLTGDGQRRVVVGSTPQQSAGVRGGLCPNNKNKSQTTGGHNNAQRPCSGRHRDGHHGRNWQPKSASGGGAGAGGGRGHRGRQNKGTHGREDQASEASVSDLEQAEQIKAQLEENAYDDLLSKYFPDSTKNSGVQAKQGEQGQHHGRNPANGQGSSRNKPRDLSSISPIKARQRGSRSKQSSPVKGNFSPGRQRDKPPGLRTSLHEHDARSIMSAEELLAEKERVEKALADAERKLQIAEEEKRLTQLDCEQMRQEIVTVVGEKAQAVQRQAEAVQERDLLAQQLDYLHMVEYSDTEETDEIRSVEDGHMLQLGANEAEKDLLDALSSSHEAKI